ncbi:MAG TPA: L-seryl-tRNA(Sec) selenium transferase [Verrucomicrobiae bacterium]|nr:L-seryl-tRNA(Sec) selenium transferase [Verrucomicrobiae bacterium]
MSTLRGIPKVDRVLEWPEVKEALAGHPRPVVLEALRASLDELRDLLRAGEVRDIPPTLLSLLRARLARAALPSLRRVVNGTGIVIHTNLGRSPLSGLVAPLVDSVAYGYSNLEFDLESGERGSRYDHVERLLCDLTGAEAAIVVNNNAAAVLLALSSLCCGKEGVVSRGELVEIGGAFRIPEVMKQGGALLREVGATNRTHLKDYREAICEQTGLLLKVHTSNFAVVGFTSEVQVPELAALGRECSIPVMVDAGSGCLLDLSRYGIAGEPTVQEFVGQGADVVTFSGDKLLGGPQAGIIVGSARYLAPMRRHPLLRALRIDKLTLAALEGTLRLYRDERRALAEVPTLRMLAATPESLRERGKQMLRRLRRSVPHLSFALLEGFSQTGGGAYPLLQLPTTLISVGCPGLSEQELEMRLRSGDPAVVGRISRGSFLLDVRTLQEDDFPLLCGALQKLS